MALNTVARTLALRNYYARAAELLMTRMHFQKTGWCVEVAVSRISSSRELRCTTLGTAST